MNIISNSCLGSFIYRDILKSPYQNPFCWNVIDDESLIYLIQNYDNINFKNFELVKDEHNNFYIIIDNKVKAWYIHYRYSTTDKIIRHEGEDVFYTKIMEYINDCYQRRLERMIISNENPIFVLGTSWDFGKVHYELVKKIANIKTKYKIIMTGNFDLDFELPKNYIYIKHSFYKDNKKLAEFIKEYF